MGRVRDKVLIQEFVRNLKDNGYVIASEITDPECEQDLGECHYVDNLVESFIVELYKEDRQAVGSVCRCERCSSIKREGA